MVGDRLAAIRKFCQTCGLDSFLITAQEDIRWACRFSGSSGALWVSSDSAILFTDSRYAVQAPAESIGVEVSIYQGDLFDAVETRWSASSNTTIGIDQTQTAVFDFKRIEAWPSNPSIRCYDAPFSDMMAVKSSNELNCLKEAQDISDQVFEEVLSEIRPGVSESHIAAQLVFRHLNLGAEKMSFDPIVASGPNAALPHAKPTGRLLEAGDLVILDFGCVVNGYVSDMTRTVGIGSVDGRSKTIYNIVRHAQEKAQEQARAGMRACDLDAAARDVIEEAGLGAAFVHSLGHGIGLRIHEPPKIAATNTGILAEGSVITIEPGVYIPDTLGVRIENAVVLHRDGCEALPKSTTELILL